MLQNSLIRKYNIAVPRYTSYPTVPYWDTQNWSENGWKESVKHVYLENKKEGISLYIHLPFCESLCTYCGCTTRITKNHQVEKPYLEAVLKEWDIYCNLLGEKPRIREMHLGGGTPTFFSPDNLGLLLQGLIERSTLLADAEMSFEAHPANTTKEHLQILYSYGFRRISLGVQDFDPIVQKAINRHQTVEDVDHVAQLARKIGYNSINFDLIYGLPLQNLSGLEKTIREVIQLKPDRIAFYSYAHIPWLKPGQRGFTELDLPEDEVKRALYELGRSMLMNAGYHDIGMDHFSLESDVLFKASLQGTLHRNFMGYTHQFTRLSIGLGVSAISDSWYAFAQNAKQVEPYIKKINAGNLDLLKGHMLTDNDLIIRKNILDIMCKARTEISPALTNKSELIKRLSELLSDGLLTINDDHLQVTDLGRAFLRNIGLCFDERYWQQQPQKQIFSTAV